MPSKGFKRAVSAPAPLPVEPEAPRRDPTTALAAAATVAPTLPPTRVEVPAPADPVAQLNLKIRESLIDQLAKAAVREGTTQKVIV